MARDPWLSPNASAVAVRETYPRPDNDQPEFKCGMAGWGKACGRPRAAIGAQMNAGPGN
jgi:hypothetical protein